MKNGDLSEIARVLKAVVGTKVVNEAMQSTGVNRLFSENNIPKNFDSAMLQFPTANNFYGF
ncbi:hypothetical protein [Pedobacter xixiisoli]|uniref:hypothetical protein n=1 Tax=Pedobacter xixiisoli TaxID=1476464 RepID=UPI00110CF29A|nr:hypothetical protein [Pedobacter xixiisoli]